MPWRRWTPEQDALVRALPIGEAARRTGHTPLAVRSRRARLGCTAKQRPWTPAEDKLARTLPPAEAASQTGRTVNAVCLRRMKLGVTPGRRQRGQKR